MRAELFDEIMQPADKLNDWFARRRFWCSEKFASRRCLHGRFRARKSGRVARSTSRFTTSVRHIVCLAATAIPLA